MRWLIGSWRPRLGTVVLGILLTVLALPLVGLFFFRLYENTLIRQTEAELIAQGAALSAIYAAEVVTARVSPDQLGPDVSYEPYKEGYESVATRGGGRKVYLVYGRYTPVEPDLDLAIDPILPPRPGPLPATPDLTFASIGEKLTPILAATQKITLAGFKLLDPRGVTIAGTQEVGLSLAHVPEVTEALRGQYASVLRQRISDQPPPSLYSISRGAKVRVFVALPVVVEGRVAGVVYLSRTPNNIVKHLYGERGKLALAGLAILAITLLIGYVFVRLISRPMRELLDRTRRIAAGEADAIRPLSHHGTREMAMLAAGFLDMARKLQDRSDTIRTFATHVSHELKSPLTSIQGAAELLREGSEDMTPEQRQKFHANIVADTERLNRLVRRLIELARAESAGISAQRSTLTEATEAVPRSVGVPIHISEGGDITFRMSAENVAIVLSNLADNSARHGATILDLSARMERGEAVVIARDNGGGVSPGNRDRIFEPFFTTRRDEGGTGMGLGIIAALLKAHGGTIRLLDTERGAGFEMRLPAG
ncbi:MAG: ATP-binding protein [Rhizobiaceae bacterium]